MENNVIHTFFSKYFSSTDVVKDLDTKTFAQ